MVSRMLCSLYIKLFTPGLCTDLVFLDMCQLHLHAGTDAVLNVTFIRAPSSAWLKVDVPLVFRGDDVSPGLKKGMQKILSCGLLPFTQRFSSYLLM